MAGGFSRNRITGTPAADEQIRHMKSNQFGGGGKTVTVTFSAANTDTEVDVGFPANNFMVGAPDAQARVWRTGGDSRFTIMQASAACTVPIFFMR